MYYCDNCARRYGLAIALFRSWGPCDLCDRDGACSEAPPETVAEKPVERREARVLSFADARRRRERASRVREGRPERGPYAAPGAPTDKEEAPHKRGK